jgi:hypothetical protein
MKNLAMILFILLSLAIATSEIPELCNLVDDPSNNAEPSALEYHAALTRSRIIADTAESPRTAIRPSAANSNSARRDAVTDGHLLFFTWTGRDVLLLISSLRT